MGNSSSDRMSDSGGGVGGCIRVAPSLLGGHIQANAFKYALSKTGAAQQTLDVSPPRFQESDRRGNGGKNRQSGRGGDASAELKFSLQSFHLFPWSHLSFSPLVSVTPTTPPPPATATPPLLRLPHPSPPLPPPPPDPGEPISPRSCFLFATVDWASPRKWPPLFIKGLFIGTTWLFCPQP